MTSIQRLPQPGDVIAGKYRIDHELGTGGMGAVYQVTHRVTGKRFALKWLLPQASGRGDAAQRFIREAQVAGRIEHPNVVEVYDVGAEADSFYMVMELLEGESLAARVERAGPLTVADACRLLIPCMHGVAEAHAAGIVHRDLKPANIFVCSATRQSGEYAKVLDFGISKVTGTPDDVTSMTKSGTLIGTPHYMPLEQIRGRAVDHRADIYSFGVVLYQVLSGKLPFPADSFSDLVLMVAHEAPRPLEQIVPRLPRGVAQIVARAMERDAADRYPHLGAMIEALAPFAELGPAAQRLSLRPPTASLSIPTPLSTESQERRRPTTASPSSAVVWIAGAIVALTLALGGGMVWMKRDALLGLDALRWQDPTPAPAAAAAANSERSDPASARTEPGGVDQKPASEGAAELQAPGAEMSPVAATPPPEAPAPAAAEGSRALDSLAEQAAPTTRTDGEADRTRPRPLAAELDSTDTKPEGRPASAPRVPDALPPVPRLAPRSKPAPGVPTDPPPPPPPELDEAPAEKPRKGRVPAITEDEFY